MTFWKTWTVAPHRVLFLSGAAQLILAMLWWLAVLVQRAGLIALPEANVVLSTAHAGVLMYATLAFFVFGFLFTAMPNWLGVRPVARRDYLLSGLPLAAGSFILYPAFYYPALLWPALGLMVFGWARALVTIRRLLRQPSQLESAPDMRQPRLVTWAVAGGFAGLLSWSGALLFGLPARLGSVLGIWAFLAPLFLAICHRMLPWFTSRVVRGYEPRRPHAVLLAWMGACLVRGGLEFTGHNPLPADLPLAVLTVYWLWRWYTPAVWADRLLAMLHVAFTWAALSFVLFVAADLGIPLGLAPLHALGTGFFGAMLMGMASRVTLGHSGRGLVCDAPTWYLFWIVQGAAVSRILADLLGGMALLLASAVLWLVAFGAWAVRYAPLTWRPRADGRPG